jgi:peptidoglycan/LPS O-acetylase OafA/YrhL
MWSFPTLLCAGVAALLFVVLRADGLPWSVLATSPFVYVGRISYSVYLFHILVQLPMFKFLPLNFISDYAVRTFCWGLISFLGTVIVATFTYRLIELPFLGLADRCKSTVASRSTQPTLESCAR